MHIDFIISFLYHLCFFLESEITKIDLDEDKYETEEFAGGDFKIFWKIIEVS